MRALQRHSELNRLAPPLPKLRRCIAAWSVRRSHWCTVGRSRGRLTFRRLLAAVETACCGYETHHPETIDALVRQRLVDRVAVVAS